MRERESEFRNHELLDVRTTDVFGFLNFHNTENLVDSQHPNSSLPKHHGLL